MKRVKKDRIKIVTIGGGSSYTPELIEGYIKRKDQLPIKEIWLVDIEEGKEKLEIVGNLAKRMVEKAGLDWEVHLTLDRRLALNVKSFPYNSGSIIYCRRHEKTLPRCLACKLYKSSWNGNRSCFKIW